jgi:hypothetical protein
MRGEQLARQWRIIRATKAGSNGLTAAEIPRPYEAQGIGYSRRPYKSLFQILGWAFLFCYGALSTVFRRSDQPLVHWRENVFYRKDRSRKAARRFGESAWIPVSSARIYSHHAQYQRVKG